MSGAGLERGAGAAGGASLKPLAGLLLAAVGIWVLVLVFREPAPQGTPLAFTSSQQCKACHPQVFAEWAASQHADSWTGPAVRKLSNDFRNTDCIDCHAPRPVFETGIGNRVLPRASRRHEGVDCIACHLLPDGRIAGTRTDREAPCRPVATPDLGRPEFCAGCHDQHETVQQWRASAYAAEGTSCIDCHMPYRDGDPARGRDHTSPGGTSLALLRSAVQLRGERSGEGWRIEVENVGAGHSFPTDERSRAADLFWRPLAAAGAEPARWRHLYRFRDPYRHEVDLPVTLLEAHGTRAVSLGSREHGPDAGGAVEVALFYKRSPYYSDPERPDPEAEADAVLVHAIPLRP